MENIGGGEQIRVSSILLSPQKPYPGVRAGLVLEQMSVTLAENAARCSLQGPSAAHCVWRVSTQGPAASLGLQPEFAHTILKSPFSPAASCEGLSGSGLEALGLEAAGPGKPVWGYHRTGELPVYILPSPVPFPYPSPACPSTALRSSRPTVTLTMACRDCHSRSGFLVELRGAHCQDVALCCLTIDPFSFPISFLFFLWECSSGQWIQSALLPPQLSSQGLVCPHPDRWLLLNRVTANA